MSELDAPDTPVPQKRMQALALRMRGLMNKEVAAAMGLSEQTVKNHIKDICGQVDAQNAIEAAFKLGWITIPEGADLAPRCQCISCTPRCVRTMLGPHARRRRPSQYLCGACDRGYHTRRGLDAG